MNGAIALVPIGPVSPELSQWLAGRLAEIIAQEVVIAEEIPLPAAGYDPRRRQYRADALVAALHSLPYPGAGRLLGLVDADAYAPGLNFVFGQARLPGREAFVALPRLRESFYGRPENEELFRQRALKEVVHELGHTWGLRHCPDPRCVMHFSNSLRDTDVKGVEFCRLCRAQRPPS